MTLNGVMAVILRYYTELVYDIIVKQLPRSQNPLFTARRNARIASAVLATAIPSACLSVCLSVRPSHAGILSKRRHVARCSLHCRIAQCV